MEPVPTGVLLFLIFLGALSRGFGPGLAAYGALLPFGSAAVILLPAVGGMNIIAKDLAVATLCGVWLGGYLLRRDPVLFRPEPSVLLWLLFLVYALFTAFAYPRLFQGITQVISFSRGAEGELIHPWLVTVLVPLAPSSGNISQSFYFTLAVVFLYFTSSLGRLRGPGILERVMIAAALVNIVLGTLDLIGLGGLLESFRSAGYAILDGHTIAGFGRLIGGFPEASAFGGFSAGLAAYTASRYLDTGRPLWGLLAGLNAFFCLAAFSSTGYLVLGTAAGILGLRFLWEMVACANRPTRLTRNFVVLLSGLFLVILFAFATPLGQKALPVLDQLIFSKSETLSGLERGLWAGEGIRVGFETLGLGAGLGSVRSNGLIAVWFANLGVPGLAFYGGFLVYLFFLQPPRFRGPEEQSMSRAATVGILVGLAGQLASLTTPLPGSVLLMAIMLTARERRIPSPQSDRLFSLTQRPDGTASPEHPR